MASPFPMSGSFAPNYNVYRYMYQEFPDKINAEFRSLLGSDEKVAQFMNDPQKASAPFGVKNFILNRLMETYRPYGSMLQAKKLMESGTGDTQAYKGRYEYWKKVWEDTKLGTKTGYTPYGGGLYVLPPKETTPTTTPTTTGTSVPKTNQEIDSWYLKKMTQDLSLPQSNQLLNPNTYSSVYRPSTPTTPTTATPTGSGYSAVPQLEEFFSPQGGGNWQQWTSPYGRVGYGWTPSSDDRLALAKQINTLPNWNSNSYYGKIVEDWANWGMPEGTNRLDLAKAIQSKSTNKVPSFNQIPTMTGGAQQQQELPPWKKLWNRFA